MVPAGDPEGDKARFLKVEPLLSMLHARDINLRLENTKLLCDAPAGAMTPDLMREIERNKDDIVKFLTARAGRDVPIHVADQMVRTGCRSRSSKKVCGFSRSSIRRAPRTTFR